MRRPAVARVAACAIVASLLAVRPALAVEPTPPGPWTFGAVTALNLSQSSFSSNWAGGDKGTIVWVVNADLTAQRQFNTRVNWANELQLAYGQTSRQAASPDGHLVWDVPDKTTDQIVFESVGRFTSGGFVDPYASLRLDSQFEDQSSPLGKIRFNPVKLKESVGIARVLQKREDREAITRVGFGLRQVFAKTIVPSTLAKVSYTANDGGLEWVTNAKEPMLGKKVLYKTELIVFLPLFYSKSDALESFDADAQALVPGREAVADFWKAPDVNWNNTFSAAITKHLSVNLFAQLVYDKFDSAADVDRSRPILDQLAEVDRNVRKAGQFKETLALGLTYRLF